MTDPYSDMKFNDAKRWKRLASDNSSVNKIVTDRAVDFDMLKEVARRTLIQPGLPGDSGILTLTQCVT